MPRCDCLLIVSIREDVKHLLSFSMAEGCGNIQYHTLFTNDNSNQPPASKSNWRFFLTKNQRLIYYVETYF